MSERSPAAEVRALQAALAGVHAAMWGYGVLGPRLAEEEQGMAYQAYDAHRGQRPLLEDMLVARDETPVAALAAYRLPFEVTGPDSARRLARRLESGCAAVYADLVAAAAGDLLRTFAATQLTACAKRHLRWQGEVTAFPGMPERA